jgi:hypothetical protein
MKVQIRIEGLSAESFHRRRVRRGDVIVTHVPAGHCAVLRYTNPLSLLCRGRDFVCSISSFVSNFATGS